MEFDASLYGTPADGNLLVVEPAPASAEADPVRVEALRLAVALYARRSGRDNDFGHTTADTALRAAKDFEAYLRGPERR